MSAQQTEPLDPDSPKGRQIAAELTELLAEFRIAIKKRRQQEQTATDQQGRAA